MSNTWDGDVELDIERPGVSWRIWDSRRQISNYYYAEKIAWPVYAWRVVVPNTETSLDPLQRAILRLADAQATDTIEIANLLGIHRDLARYLQLVCISEGVLDQHYHLTKTGHDKLLGLDRVDDGGDTEDGWIFRDAVTGDVLPLFHQGSLPILKRRHEDTHYQLPSQNRNAMRPASASISNALRQYRRLLRVEREQDVQSDLDKDLFDPDAPIDWSVVPEQQEEREENHKRAPSLVRMVTSRPELLAFEVIYYVCPEAPQAWYLTAPLGRAGGWWYRRKLDWAAERDPDIAAHLSSWQRTAEELFAPSEEMILSVSETRQEFAEFYGCLGLGEALIWWERACAARCSHSDSYYDADGVYNRCQIVLELVLDACIDRIADKYALLEDIRYDPSRTFLRQMTGELLVKLPNKMAWKDTSDTMSKVASGEMRSLRDRAVFLLYAAYYDYSHAFYGACNAQSDLLEMIDDIAELRNEYGAHSGRKSGEPDHTPLIEEAMNKTRCVLQTLGSELCKEGLNTNNE